MKHLHNISTSNKTQQGFTLIEVLVASFILFLVIAGVTMVYRGAVLSSHKAERSLKIASMVEPISEQIRLHIQSSSGAESQGQGTMGAINFSWNAIQTSQAKAPESLDGESGNITQGNKTFRLWHITLELKLNKATRHYSFSEVSW